MFDKYLRNELGKQKILPILNTTDLNSDNKRLELFLDKNPDIKNIEITLRKPNSLEIATSLKKNFSNLKFGLGSILAENDLKKGIDLGFSFFVSPGIVKNLTERKVSNYIPGAETISEFIYLESRGYKIIKFFPSNISGAQKKLLSIETILQELMFIPTGGININNYLSYLSIKNVLCVGMSKFDK